VFGRGNIISSPFQVFPGSTSNTSALCFLLSLLLWQNFATCDNIGPNARVFSVFPPNAAGVARVARLRDDCVAISSSFQVFLGSTLTTSALCFLLPLQPWRNIATLDNIGQQIVQNVGHSLVQ
jgi:hypothetical protein